MVEFFDQTNKKLLKRYNSKASLYIKKAYKTLKLNDKYSFTVIVCGSAKIRSLNKYYRDIDKVTDVLSFEENSGDKEDYYLGEVFINVDRVYSQARNYGHSVLREYTFLIVHGLLHLCGYDHTRSLKDEKIQFDLQDKILKGLK